MGSVVLLLVTAALFAQAYRAARLVEPLAATPTAALFTAVAGLAEIILLLEVNPSGRGLTLRAAGFLLAQGVVLWFLPRRRAAERGRPAAEVGGGEPAAALLWLTLCAVILQALPYGDPPMYHDGLTYHLAFAVEWLTNGNLDPPLQAYGDIAPPFYPLNSSLVYLWALAFACSDFWARSAQAPFVVVMAAAVLSLGRALDARPGTGLVAVLALFSAPLVRAAYREQGNDVILAALLLAAAAFLVEIHRTGGALARAGFPLAIALALGTKVLAAVYAPPLLVAYLWLVRRTRWLAHVAWLAACLLALAAFSYVRNWRVTGGALFPARFDVPGLRAELGGLGGYDVYGVAYARGCRTLGDLGEIGAATALALVAGAVAYAVAERRRLLRSPALGLLALAAFGTAAFYAVVPYRHCRLLLFPALLLVPVAAAGLGRVSAPAIDLATRAATHLGRWRRALALAAAVGLLALCLRVPAYERDKLDRWAGARVAGRHYGRGWAAVPAGPLRIAMSATQNMPYPLYGRCFENRVFFVPADGRRPSLYYGLATETVTPFSGMTERGWTEAILRLEADLFWSAVDMATGAFGQEDAWARQRPEMFEPIHADPEVRVYRVRRP